MKATIYILIFLSIAYLAYGWIGVYWSIPLGIILFFGVTEIALGNIKKIKIALKNEIKELKQKKYE